MYLWNKWLNPELFGPSTPCCSRAIKKRVPLQGTVPGCVTSPRGLVEFRRCRLTDCCLQSPASGMHVLGIPQLSLEHTWDNFSLAPCPTRVWVYLWKCVTAMEGIKWPRWRWEPPFSLHPNTCCLCTPAGGHQHAVLSPPCNEMLWGTPPCRQPACSQGPQRPLQTVLPCSPAQPGKASSQEKEICACKTSHLVWSHKHKAPGCVAFQEGVALEKVQRSGMNFPEHWLKTLQISLGFTMSHWNSRKAIHWGNQKE